MTDLWAKKGEHLTCENGHVIATVARDIVRGEIAKGDEWEGWTQSQPQTGSLPPLACGQCGAPFFGRTDAGGFRSLYHFEDGWR